MPTKTRNYKQMAALELAAAITSSAVINVSKEGRPNIVAAAVYDIQKLAASLHKRYEAACSYEWANTEKYERRTETLEAQALAIGASLGVTVEHQRDPRGWPIKVHVADREYALK